MRGFRAPLFTGDFEVDRPWAESRYVRGLPGKGTCCGIWMSEPRSAVTGRQKLVEHTTSWSPNLR